MFEDKAKAHADMSAMPHRAKNAKPKYCLSVDCSRAVVPEFWPCHMCIQIYELEVNCCIEIVSAECGGEYVVLVNVHYRWTSWNLPLCLMLYFCRLYWKRFIAFACHH